MFLTLSTTMPNRTYPSSAFSPCYRLQVKPERKSKIRYDRALVPVEDSPPAPPQCKYCNDTVCYPHPDLGGFIPFSDSCDLRKRWLLDTAYTTEELARRIRVKEERERKMKEKAEVAARRRWGFE